MLHNLTRTLLICALTLATALVPVSAAEMTTQQAALEAKWVRNCALAAERFDVDYVREIGRAHV